VSPVWEQASVLADVLTGRNPGARYRGSKLYTRLKVAGVDVATMGASEPERDEDDVLQVVQDRRDSYRKLIVRDRKLVGAILVGDTEAAATLVQHFDRGDLLPQNPLELLAPSAAPVDPARRTVCNCHRVTQADVTCAIAEGAASVEAIGAATKAGTGCGSCKTELAQLLARTPPNRERAPLPVIAAAAS